VRFELALSIRCSLSAFALKACGDRSIRTPTSESAASAAQRIDQAEENGLPWVVGQDAEEQAAGLADDLAGDGEERGAPTATPCSVNGH